MAPIKFEEHIKDKLDGRTIRPSEGAWESLSSQLSAGRSPKKGRAMWYMVAAGFIGIIGLSLLCYDQAPHMVPNTMETVDTGKQNDKPITDGARPGELENKMVVAQEDTSKSREHLKEPGKMETLPDLEDHKTIVSQEVVGVPEREPVVSEVNILINNKVSDLVQQVAAMEEAQHSVTEREVDSLLRKAQKELLRERLFTEGQVDAMALLAEAEGELDQSFRDRIFEALKDGFFKVRTAVATRND
ncbi:MAG: hypothetical protein V7724_12600 [Sediminicola sp.]|tara:strand:- start:67798 stop:68532 length:735 start_codon:yes stop_codon:yes gene_type:complete